MARTKKQTTELQSLLGSRFDRLVVIRLTDRSDAKQNAIVEVLCDCGNTIEVSAVQLRVGDSKSCGCLARELQVKSGEITGATNKGKGRPKRRILSDWAISRLGEQSDQSIAKELGILTESVRLQRIKRGIKAFKPRKRNLPKSGD